MGSNLVGRPAAMVEVEEPCGAICPCADNVLTVLGRARSRSDDPIQRKSPVPVKRYYTFDQWQLRTGALKSITALCGLAVDVVRS